MHGLDAFHGLCFVLPVTELYDAGVGLSRLRLRCRPLLSAPLKRNWRHKLKGKARCLRSCRMTLLEQANSLSKECWNALPHLIALFDAIAQVVAPPDQRHTFSRALKAPCITMYDITSSKEPDVGAMTFIQDHRYLNDELASRSGHLIEILTAVRASSELHLRMAIISRHFLTEQPVGVL
eukprot:1910940-Pleurochrysis_carterae.AAC.3